VGSSLVVLTYLLFELTLRRASPERQTLDAATSRRTTARVSLRVNSYSTTRTTRDAS